MCATEMAQLVTRTVAWLAEHGPEWLSPPNPGASEAALAQLEAQLGRELPSILRDLLHAADGELAIGEYKTLSAADVYRTWALLNRLAAEGRFANREVYPDDRGLIRADWWHPGYLPFAEDSCGNLICVDLDPGPQGIVGQIVWWETAEGPLVDNDCIPALADFLQAYWDNLASGAYDAPDVWDNASAQDLTRRLH